MIPVNQQCDSGQSLRLKIASPFVASLFILLLCLQWSSSCVAQNYEDSLLSHIDEYFVEMEKFFYEKGHSPLFKFDYPDSLDDNVRALYSQKEESELHSLSSSTGLQITGQAYKRLDGDVGLNDDDEATVYAAKFQLGLEWDIMKSPLAVTQAAKNLIILENKKSLTTDFIQLRERVKAALNDSAKKYYEHIYYSLWTLERENLSKQLLLYKVLNEKNMLNFADIADLMNNLVEIDARTALLGNASCFPSLVIIPTLDGLYSINDSLLWQLLSEENLDLLLLKQNSQLISGKREALSYWNGVRIAPFIRTSHYLIDESNVNNKTDLDLGVTFTFPIDWSVKQKRKTLATDEIINNLYYEQRNEELRGEIEQLCEQYNTYVELCRIAFLKFEMKKEFLKKVLSESESSFENNYFSKLKDYYQLLESMVYFHQSQEKATGILIELEMLLYPSSIEPCLQTVGSQQSEVSSTYQLYFDMINR